MILMVCFRLYNLLFCLFGWMQLKKKRKKVLSANILSTMNFPFLLSNWSNDNDILFGGKLRKFSLRFERITLYLILREVTLPFIEIWRNQHIIHFVNTIIRILKNLKLSPRRNPNHWLVKGFYFWVYVIVTKQWLGFGWEILFKIGNILLLLLKEWLICWFL